MTKLRFVWGFIALALASSSQAQTSTISLVAETNHSTVQFNVPISKGITRITGKFNTYTIAMTLPDGDLARATIKAVIQAASINTGDAGRDEDLKTEDFFDAAKYPEIICLGTGPPARLPRPAATINAAVFTSRPPAGSIQARHTQIRLRQRPKPGQGARQ